MRSRLPVWMGALAFASLLSTQSAQGHCEIPCGIYGDQMRFAMWEEAITTVEKSMKEIVRLSAEDKPNTNQVVRWVQNKEKHAQDIRELAVQYFLAQRVKPVEPGDTAAHRAYLRKLELLHRIVVHAMKAKQTTDLAHVKALRGLVHDFQDAYSGAAAGHSHEKR